MSVMSPLQWALLILSVGIVLAVVIISRRERGASQRRMSFGETEPVAARREAPEADDEVKQQLDIFDSPAPSPVAAEAMSDEPVESVSPRRPAKDVAPAAPPEPLDHGIAELPPESVPVASPLASPQYDEYGVGRPRRRVMPSVDGEKLSSPLPSQPTREPPSWLKASQPSVPTVPAPPVAPSVAPPLRTEVKPAAAPSRVEAPAPAPSVAPRAPTPPPAAPAVPQKIVSLLLVERHGGVVQGGKLHSALAAQGLSFGAKQIYHRTARSEPVFSVASLVKPGVLLPDQAEQFSTPGLQIFMVLPGPVKPLTALHDMLSTTQALARALDADVFDSKKQPLTSESMRALQADVEGWARAAGL